VTFGPAWLTLAVIWMVRSSPGLAVDVMFTLPCPWPLVAVSALWPEYGPAKAALADVTVTIKPKAKVAAPRTTMLLPRSSLRVR
jgi:hypothetical protein